MQQPSEASSNVVEINNTCKHMHNEQKKGNKPAIHDPERVFP